VNVLQTIARTARRLRQRTLRCLRVGLLLLCASCLGTGAAHADERQDRQLQSFADGVGELLYFFAWPTAKYRRLSFDGATKREGGVDLKLTLHGISAFDDDALWTELVLEIRHGRVSDIRWGRNNAVLFRPGETMVAMGQALAELSREYQRSNGAAPEASPPPAPGRGAPAAASPAVPASYSALCLSNPTARPIAYALSWSGRQDARTLQPNESHLYWSADPQASFAATFDNSYDAGYTPSTVLMRGKVRSGQPASCNDAARYDFQAAEQRLGILPADWQPGFVHPFIPNLVAAAQAGRWQCAPGTKWRDPSDVSSTDCVAAGEGLIGVRFDAAEGLAYPFIRSVRVGGPAALAGVQDGVWLVSVNGVSTARKTLAETVELLRGPTGSTVTLGIAAPGGPVRQLTVMRD
jgi:hypothetical protein